MKPQQQPNEWSCLPTAFAIVLDVPIRELIARIGHDGTEKYFPHLFAPYCYRSFHVEDITSTLLDIDYGLIIISSNPQYEVLDKTYTITYPGDRMLSYLENYVGVLCGNYPGRTPHAVAWDGENIHDPTNCETRTIDNFNVETFLIITKINITK